MSPNLPNETVKSEQKTSARLLLPPFTIESAKQKVREVEMVCNMKDPELASSEYSINTEWHVSNEYLNGRDEVQQFLERKWAKKLNYKLRNKLWAFSDNWIAISFEYEWCDRDGQWYRSYGNENWEFDEQGYIEKSNTSTTDVLINKSDRKLR